MRSTIHWFNRKKNPIIYGIRILFIHSDQIYLGAKMFPQDEVIRTLSFNCIGSCWIPEELITYWAHIPNGLTPSQRKKEESDYDDCANATMP